MIILLEVASILIYLAIFVYTWRNLTAGRTLSNYTVVALIIALLAHGFLCYKLIDGGQGQNLSLFNIFSMTTWLAMWMVCWNLIKHRAHSLLLVTLPIAAISILEATLLNRSNILILEGKPLNLLHIFTGIAAMSILLLSALQSILVLYLDRGLKHHPANIHQWLGPLQGMERYLIQLLTVGFIFMSISLALVIWLPMELKSNQAIHKVVLTVASWLVLSVLMFGRYVRGWRGVFAARWSLVGVLLLLTGYFGSKLVLEYIVS
ncbi:inner membrane protein YpjD [Aliikangiella sp. G2MR2-5]|uniref:cytochrome C assembly family protein n=1 Tax=Aliikangiella sp. G2MR2-5 TaxID=2788943 RepID=UPI0018A8914F|nr:cytochrome c biogenesis protein CcsA [Aliikangiella sp. G2MR2-5]